MLFITKTTSSLTQSSHLQARRSPSLQPPLIHFFQLILQTETLFSSSRSFLSLSSSKSILFSSDPDSKGLSRISIRRRPPNAQRREARKNEMKYPPLEEKVKGSFAVVKKSRDPYTDFRTSMVEMIMEKQIFGAKELE